jgi:hypothetical protein
MPALSDALEWLGPGADAPADGRAARWFLLPASALIHASVLDGLLAAPPGRPAVLAESAEGIAPVALLPATPPATLWPNTLWPNTLWKDLAAGRPVGPELARWLRETGAVPRGATGPYVDVRDAAGLARAEAALEATLSIAADSGMDRYLHRRCSRWITPFLVRTNLTPNHVSLVSLAIGLGAIWCFWSATPASAFAGVLLYALACIVDHADGELARCSASGSPRAGR